MSKISLIALGAILLLCTTLFAQSELKVESSLPDSLQRAITLAAKSHNADLLYNIGVDFFSMGERGMANLYFLKALNINSAHKFARANLDTSIRLGLDARHYPEHLFLVRALMQTLDFFSVNRLALLSLFLLLGAALSLIWLLQYDPEKERALPILVLALFALLALASFTALGIKSYQQKHNSLAVLISSSSPFYAPQGNSALWELHSGMIVKVLNDRGKYWLVRLPDGQTGRLQGDHLQKVLDK